MTSVLSKPLTEIHPALRESTAVMGVDTVYDDCTVDANDFLSSLLQLTNLKIEGGGDKIAMPFFSAADGSPQQYPARLHPQGLRKRSAKVPIKNLPTSDEEQRSLPGPTRYNLFPTIAEQGPVAIAPPKVLKARRSSSALGEHDISMRLSSASTNEPDETFAASLQQFPSPPARFEPPTYDPPPIPTSAYPDSPSTITAQSPPLVRRHSSSQNTVTSDRSVPALSYWSQDSSISSTTARSPPHPSATFHRPTNSTTASISSKASSKFANFRFRALMKPTSALIEAAKLGDYHETLRLLAPGFQFHPLDATDKEGYTALHWACRLGHSSVARALVARHASIEARTKAQGRTPLYFAAQNGFTDIVAALVEAGAIIDAKSDMDGATALHKAAHQGHETVIQQLINAGADPNQRDVEGMPPLMWATQGKQLGAAHLLISNGADMEIRIKLGANLEMSSREGTTVLHRAVQTSNHSFARLFVELGANVNAPGPNGMQPLHRAVAKGDADMTGLLVEHGADLAGRTEEGWTPLHTAARYGHGRICRILIGAGAEEGWLTNTGATARDLARLGGFDDLF